MSPGVRSERGLVRLIRVLLLFESAMYSAITPVLPHYAHALHASKPAIGVLAAGYPAGLLPGALIGGWLAGRHGVRRTTLAGLVGFGLAIAGFGLATDLVALDALRAVQGAFCGLIWGGGLTWVIAAVPRERRGATIGSVIGAAAFGTLLGPLLGTVAVTSGTGPVFAATGAVALGLAAWARRFPPPVHPATPRGVVAQLRAGLRAGGLGLGTWLITLEAIAIGATNTLLPLRLARFGAPGWAIGATFLGAAAVSTVLSPVVGRSVDRRGAPLTIAIGLVTGAPLLAVLVLPRSPLALAALSVIALGAPLAACMIPSVSLMTAATERAGVTLLLATTAVNLAYAVGETIGAPVAAGLSQATSDAVPLLLIAGLMLATLVLVRRAPQRPSALEGPPCEPPTRPHGPTTRPIRRPDGASPARPGRSPSVGT